MPRFFRHVPVSLQDPRDALAFGVLFAGAVLAALAYFVLYVQPREDFLLAVTECVGEDTSEVAWKRCAEEVRIRLSDPDAEARPTP